MARVAYADPPYVGQAKRHYRNDPSGIAAAEVDHAALIAQLERDYDGWALSLSSPSLREILPLCPTDVRVGAWVKSFAAPKSINPWFAWEPVILKLPRKANYPRVRDWVQCPIVLKGGTHGAKPPAFCYWLFDALNMVRDDELVDMYPGSGAVTAAWQIWRRQAPATRRRKAKDAKALELWTA